MPSDGKTTHIARYTVCSVLPECLPLYHGIGRRLFTCMVMSTISEAARDLEASKRTISNCGWQWHFVSRHLCNIGGVHGGHIRDPQRGLLRCGYGRIITRGVVM